MKAEIVSVGTELLLGAITDTNATYLAQRLAALGIDLHHVSQVGDNLGRIVEVLRRAWDRSDLTITTGGIGPTQDDLTREAIAELLGETRSLDAELESHLRSLYSRRAMRMPQSNLKQAMLIPSATALNNPVGTAPGWIVRGRRGNDVRTIVAMPGVPFEMKRMWEREVEPGLRHTSGHVIVSRTLKTLGVGESRVEELVSDLMRSLDPTVAPYAKNDGVHLRITCKAPDEATAREKIAAMELAVRQRLGDAIYGADDDSPHSIVSQMLEKLGLRFVVLEVGSAALGALGPALGSHALCGGVISAISLNSLSTLLGWRDMPESLEGAVRAIQSPASPVVLAVGAEVELLGDITAMTFQSDVILLLRDGEVARARSAWRSTPSEIARLSGLAALNLLRKELATLLNAREGTAVC